MRSCASGQAVDSWRGPERRDRRLGTPLHAGRGLLRLRGQPPATVRHRGAAGARARLLLARWASAETSVPATRASIAAIAALHAAVTLDVLAGEPADVNGECRSWLTSLKRVPGVFDEPYRLFRFRTERSPTCLVCGRTEEVSTRGDLDVALDQALDRLAPQ